MSKIFDNQLFPFGDVGATPEALQALQDIRVSPLTLLYRHGTGDWGDLEEEDKQENDFSLTRRLRLFSAYQVTDELRIWIITEADRSATTLLLPGEH